MFIPFLLVIGEHNCPVLIDQPGKGKVFSTVKATLAIIYKMSLRKRVRNYP